MPISNDNYGSLDGPLKTDNNDKNKTDDYNTNNLTEDEPKDADEFDQDEPLLSSYGTTTNTSTRSRRDAIRQQFQRRDNDTSNNSSSSRSSYRYSNSRSRRPSMFDSWLRRDYSARHMALFSSILSSENGSGGGSGSGSGATSAAERFMGPTEYCIEDMIRTEGAGIGLEYKSVDRGLTDTAVWHQRKVSLMEAETKREENKGSGLDAAAGEMSHAYEYKYDAAAVARLEGQRWVFDRVLVIVIGVCMAVTGYVVSGVADTILDKKLELALERLENHKDFGVGMAIHVGISSLLALAAFLPVAYRPVSAGSGIAEAKATLNGVIIPNCTAMITAVCKGLSVILSVAASLPAGLEGPMIHLGLCIGENANRLVPSHEGVYDPLRTDRSRIDYAAIGTAAGVAAAFKSPISGVLFAMEEGSSFWSTQLTWRCFLSACITVISMYGIKALHSQGSFHITSMALFNGIEETTLTDSDQLPQDYNMPDFQFWEYSMFVLVGAAGGLIGAAFCTANRSLAILRRYLSFGTTMKCVEVVCISAICASLIWLLPSIPFFSSCRDIEGMRMGSNFYRQYNCPEGQYNELATLLLNPLGQRGITLLFQEEDLDAFSIKTCCTAGLLHLIILCIAFGMSVSAGIFIPLLFIGACLGRAFALFVGLDPRAYAIIGSAATLGGVVRVLISLTAIVTHTTSLSFFMTPVMVATLGAQIVGNWASGRPGIYDVILHLRGVPFLEEECPVGARHANIRARNVMKPEVTTIRTFMSVKELVKNLKEFQYSDFPVVDTRTGALIGSISREVIRALLYRKDIFVWDREHGSGSSSNGGLGGDDNADNDDHKTLSYAELEESRRQCPQTVEALESTLTTEDKEKFIYLAPYLQIAPHTFDGHGSAERAYEMFRDLGLRNLVVVDKNYRPIGIITRHELALLEEIGMHEHEVVEKRHEMILYSSVRIGESFRNQFE